MKINLDELEKQKLYEDDINRVPPSDIVAYNELRSCADLFRMHKQQILEIQPEFQRDVVWLGPAQTRFIDSLIKQLPIPSMCFALDYKKQKWMVIDGLQRISTIVRFLSGSDWKLSNLEDIEQEIAGISVAAIKNPKSKLHSYYTRVENLSIPITVLRCEFDNKAHKEYLFTIFHRLNTGGMKLNNQEIRNCIFGGSLNDLLKRLDSNRNWRKINKMKQGESYRFSKQELILRFFAFHDKHTKYTGHLANFLNSYMGEHQNANEEFVDNKADLFTRTVECLYKNVFADKGPGKFPNTVLEGVLIGVGKNIDYLEKSSPSIIQRKYRELHKNEQFSSEALTEGLSKRPRVIERLNTAIKIFAEHIK